MKFKYIIVGLLLLQGSLAHAIPRQAITDYMNGFLSKIASPEEYKTFLTKNPLAFPEIKDPNIVNVITERLEVPFEGDTYTLGIGYRQFQVKCSYERAKKLLNSPELFKSLYGLDGDSKVDIESSEIAQQTADQESFQARIMKSVPVISNQDFILQYSNSFYDPFWFQRAKLVVDKADFALRDNLKTIEVLKGTKDSVVMREISMVYILRWYLRALGPQVRSIMKSELERLSRAEKCTLESDQQLSHELAKSCWIKSK